MVENKEILQKISLIRTLFNEIYSINPIYETKDTTNKNVLIPAYFENNSSRISLYGLLANSQPLTLYEKNYYAFKETTHLFDDVKLVNYIKGYYAGHLNFSIYETKVFHLTVHLKLEKNPTNTYNLKIIFSFWWDLVKVRDSIDLTYFNTIYNDLILGQKLSNILFNFGYTKISLLDIETFEPKKYSNQIDKKLWLAHAPLIHFTITKNILNANPIKLIDEFIEHYESIENELIESEKIKIQTPEAFYESLSNELKTFLLKGKDLFKLAENTFNFEVGPEVQKENELKVSVKEKKSGLLTPHIILKLFQKEYEKDRNTKIIKKDRGFRSLSEIHEKYGLQYKFSRQTLYNYFKESNLEIILEKRYRNKKGGGFEFRIKAKELFEKIDEVSLREKYMKERMLVEEALIHYNKKEIDKTIQIIEKILENPSEQFHNDQYLYPGVSYYLAKCYFKKENYKECLDVSNQVLDTNSELMEVNFLRIESLFKLRKYNDLVIILENTKTFIHSIFKRFQIPIDEVKGLIYGKFPPSSVNNKEFFKTLSSHDDLTKYVILINKSKVKRRYYFRPRVENVEFYNRNSIGFETLYKYLARSLILSIEIERRKFFYSLLNKDHTGMQNSLSKSIELMTSDLSKQIFETKFFFHYLNYFRHHLELFVGKDAQETLDILIQNKVPQFEAKDYFFVTFPKKYHEFHDSVTNINKCYRFQKEYDSNGRIFYLGFSKFNDPELNAENIYLLAYSVDYNDIFEFLIQDIEKELQLLKNKEIDTLNEFISEWWDFSHPYLQMGLYPQPIVLLNLVEEVLESSKKNNITDLTAHIETLYNRIKPKIMEFENLRKQAQGIIKNRMFRQLHQKFTLQEEKIILNFTDKIDKDKDPEDAFFDVIYPVLNDTMRKKSGKRRIIEIKLPDMDLEEVIIRNLNIYQKSHSNLPFDDSIITHPSKNSFLFKEICVYQYQRSNSIFDNIESIFHKIADLLNRNFNEIIIKAPDLEKQNEIQDFITEIQSRLKNNYFNFEFEDKEDLSEIKMVIVSKNA